jgi:predicted lipoprotein
MTRLVLALILSVLGVQGAKAEIDDGALARNALQGYIRPGYARFAETAAALNRSVQELCNTPSDAALSEAKKAFLDTVEAWSRVEPIRFGSVA